MSKRVYLSPERRPAPHGPYAVGGTYEHIVCGEIAVLEKAALERCGFGVIIAPAAYSLEQRVKWANENNIDYYQAIHSNGADGKATGAECLYYNHPASIKANRLVYDELVKLYPSKRGVKDYTGFYENNMTKMVSCYPEIGFHDNPADARFIIDNKQQIAEALAKGICAYFDIAYIPAFKASPAEDTTAPPSSGGDYLCEEIEKLKLDVIELNARITALEAKLKAA